MLRRFKRSRRPSAYASERGVIRMKSQRRINKRHEAMSLLLQLAQLDEVVDALLPFPHAG